jgi:aminoglycoside phosphotransferase (APT) family kinase protein
MTSEDLGPLRGDEIGTRLASWLRTRLGDAEDVRVEGLGRVEVGHSAEMLALTIVWRTASGEERRDVVVRLRPPSPGLLEPYDLARQFRILRGLEKTAVKAPRALWLEPSGDVLGRPFFVMERLEGEVYEREVPATLAADPARIRRMSESLVEQIAAIHRVDLGASGLADLGDGRDYLDRELARWSGEMRRVARGPLPALERLLAALRERQPEQSPTVTLVHGDAKPGNFAFSGSEVSAVFDWEMADVGDPLADVGWAEILWRTPSITSQPSSLGVDEFVARWEQLTGIRARHREWYRAFQTYKMAVIMLVGGMLFDAGHSDDLRLAGMASVVPFVTQLALGELGVSERPEPGPMTVREERLAEVKGRRS